MRPAHAHTRRRSEPVTSSFFTPAYISSPVASTIAGSATTLLPLPARRGAEITAWFPLAVSPAWRSCRRVGVRDMA